MSGKKNPNDYNPREYWENRLAGKFSLKGVGHQGYSEQYNQWLYKAKRRALNRMMARHHLAFRGKTACDLGCGTGFMTNLYAELGVDHVQGVDITQVSVERLQQQYPHYRFLCENIALPDLVKTIERSFDVVSAFDVLYHITDDQLFQQAVRNISILTKQRGTILITDFYGPTTIHTHSHVKFRDRRYFNKTFAANQIEVQEVIPLYCLLNREPFSWIKSARIKKYLRAANERCAPLYYFVDGFLKSPRHSSMNLILAKKVDT